MPLYTYTIFDDPSASPGNTPAFAINGAGHIVGSAETVGGLHG